jgi:pilus assembly protein CpaE
VAETSNLRVLLIDDEPFFYKMLIPTFRNTGYELEYARNGNEGMTKMATYKPEVIILDVRLPDMSGFEIIERLRKDPVFNTVPVIFVSGQNQLNDKLRAFELGADDYLEKPFQAEELVARIGILARHSKAIKIVKEIQPDEMPSTVVAVHSLRGGVGVSSLAVNLGLSFFQIWQKPTLVIDGVLNAGQVAMLLDGAPNVTWENFVEMSSASIDDEMVRQLAGLDKTGIRYVAAPRFPIAVDSFTEGFFETVLEKFVQHYDFIVIDTAHDFSDMTIEMLSIANQIVLMMTPDMASLRAAMCAINIYSKLGFEGEKVKILVNNINNQPGIKNAQIEKVLGHPVDLVLPYSPTEVNRAINVGEPFMLKNAEFPLRNAVEDIAYLLTNKIHKNIPPAAPTAAWKRVMKRFPEKK